jgi:hypothetical protein
MDDVALLGCFMDYLPSALQPDALRVCLGAVRSAEAPVVDKDGLDLVWDSDETRDRVYTGLARGPVDNVILSHCLQGISYSTPFTEPQRLAVFIEFWPKINRWVQYYTMTSSHHVEPSHANTEGEMRMLTVLASIAVFLSHIPQPFDGVSNGIRAQDDRTFETVCRIWLRVIPYKRVPLPVKSQLMDALGTFLENARVSTSWSLNEARTVLQRTADSSKNLGNVAKTLTSFFDISVSFHKGGVIEDVATSSVNVAALLLHKDDQDAWEASPYAIPLVKRNITKILCAVFGRTAGAAAIRPMAGSTLESAGSLMGKTLQTIAGLIKSPVAHIILPAMMAEGLFESLTSLLLRHVPNSPRDSPLVAIVVDLFGIRFPSLLHNYSVLSSFIKVGLNSAVKRRFNGPVELYDMKESATPVEWEYMEQVAVELSAIKATYDILLRGKDSQMCQNVGN